MQSYCSDPSTAGIAGPAIAAFAATIAGCSCARSIYQCFCRRIPSSRDCGPYDGGSATAISLGIQLIYLNQCIDRRLLRHRNHLLRCQPTRPNHNRSSSLLVASFHLSASFFAVALIWASVYHLEAVKAVLNYCSFLCQRFKHSEMIKYALPFQEVYATNQSYHRHFRDLTHRLKNRLKNLDSNHCGPSSIPSESKSSLTKPCRLV